MDDEFDNFMDRVTEVENLLKQMQSSDPRVAERARRRADLLLGSKVHGSGAAAAALQGQSTAEEDKAKDVPERQSDRLDLPGRGDGEGRLRCRNDRTVINQRAFDRIGKTDDPAEMSKELFMAQVEKDAESRAKDRVERKRRSDELKSKGNKAFREKQFERALDLFCKAIDETRDDVVLFENRALTYLNLELYGRTVEDCDWALRLNENSLKALLYKAKALFWLKQGEECEKCIAQALMKHPDQQNLIKEYKKMWIEPAVKNHNI